MPTFLSAIILVCSIVGLLLVVFGVLSGTMPLAGAFLCELFFIGTMAYSVYSLNY